MISMIVFIIGSYIYMFSKSIDCNTARWIRHSEDILPVAWVEGFLEFIIVCLIILLKDM